MQFKLAATLSWISALGVVQLFRTVCLRETVPRHAIMTFGYCLGICAWLVCLPVTKKPEITTISRSITSTYCSSGI